MTYLLIFFSCFILYVKSYNFKFAYLSIILLIICRFVLDFFRVQIYILLVNLNLAQILCTLVIVIGIKKLTSKN